jgi:hypothetical protein
MFLVDSKAGELHAQIFDIGYEENEEEENGRQTRAKSENGQESSSTRTEIK